MTFSKYGMQKKNTYGQDSGSRGSSQNSGHFATCESLKHPALRRHCSSVVTVMMRPDPFHAGYNAPTLAHGGPGTSSANVYWITLRKVGMFSLWIIHPLSDLNVFGLFASF